MSQQPLINLHPDTIQAIVDGLAAKASTELTPSSDISYIDDVDASSNEEVEMGINYVNGCWHVDVGYRVGDKVRSCTGRVRGGKRETKPEAKRLLQELKERARMLAGGIASVPAPQIVAPPQPNVQTIHPVQQPAKTSSMTFGDGVDKYITKNPQAKDDIRSTLNYLSSELGDFELDESFQEKYLKFLGEQRIRKVQRWKKVDGELKLVDTDTYLSKASVQVYMRYVKAILRLSGYGNLIEGITVGKTKARRRPISPNEMERLEKTITDSHRWFYPAFDFSRKNPIRPQDLFRLTAEEHIKDGRIIYTPSKTEKTGLSAYPIVFKEMRNWFDNLPKSGLLFTLNGNVSYESIWRKIRKEANLPDIQFYDLRHHAVAFMRSKGIEDWRIARAAGWSGTEMLQHYDPNNEFLIAEYDLKLAV
jgi:integrase